MARAIANVQIATDSFASWVGITNQMADTFTNYALTANSAAAGATVTGNSQLIGIFGSNTIAVGTALRGGNVATTTNLNITSNTIQTGALLKSTANVYFEAANVYSNGANFKVVGGILTSTSNVYVEAANTTVNGAVFRVVGGLVTITSNVYVHAANTYVNG